MRKWTSNGNWVKLLTTLRVRLKGQRRCAIGLASIFNVDNVNTGRNISRRESSFGRVRRADRVEIVAVVVLGHGRTCGEQRHGGGEGRRRLHCELTGKSSFEELKERRVIGLWVKVNGCDGNSLVSCIAAHTDGNYFTRIGVAFIHDR